MDPGVLAKSMSVAANFLSGFVPRYNPRQWLKPKHIKYILPEAGRGSKIRGAASAYYTAMEALARELTSKAVDVTLRDDGRSEGPTACAVAAVDAALILAAAEQWPMPLEVSQRAQRPTPWSQRPGGVLLAQEQERRARATAVSWIPPKALSGLLQIHWAVHGRGVSGMPTTPGINPNIEGGILLLGTPVGVGFAGVPVTRGFSNSSSSTGTSTLAPSSLRGGVRSASWAPRFTTGDMLQPQPGPQSVRQFRETVISGVREVLNAAFARHEMTSITVEDMMQWLHEVRNHHMDAILHSKAGEVG
jgi:hypothetical protein